MIGSIYSDTEALSNDTTTFADEEAVRALSGIAGFSDLDTFWKEMHEAALSYEGMTDEEIFLNDYKEYECAGVHYGIGVIKASDEEALEVLKAGFGETWEFDGKGYLTSPGVSRKSGVVPVITEVLNQFPHE